MFQEIAICVALALGSGPLTAEVQVITPADLERECPQWEADLRGEVWLCPSVQNPVLGIYNQHRNLISVRDGDLVGYLVGHEYAHEAQVKTGLPFSEDQAEQIGMRCRDE